MEKDRPKGGGVESLVTAAVNPTSDDPTRVTAE